MIASSLEFLVDPLSLSLSLLSRLDVFRVSAGVSCLVQGGAGALAYMIGDEYLASTRASGLFVLVVVLLNGCGSIVLEAERIYHLPRAVQDDDEKLRR